MIEAKGYSIWLIPSLYSQVYSDLSDLISKLSICYSPPKFEPHVTLIGGLEGLEEDLLFQTSEFAKHIKPFKIELAGLDYLEDPLRCLFIKAKETKELMEANLKARKIFSRELETIYMPHLSLMYGHFSKDIKEKIISEIGKELSFTFDVDKIHLFSTKREPKDWYLIKDFTLSA